MSLYEKLFKKVIFPFYDKTLHKRKTVSYLKDYQHNLHLGQKEIEALQWVKLKDLLQHCIDNVSYYRETWAELGFHSASDFKTMEDFERLPILTKQIVRDNHQKLIAVNYQGKNLKKATGGSTGQPMNLELNLESEERRQAIMWRGYGEIGAGLGVKTIFLWGADTGKQKGLANLKNELYHGLFNRKLLNSFKLTQNNMMEYIEEINNYQPEAMVSFVNPLFEMAKYILDNNVTVYSPKSIVTGAEALHDHQRVVIEKAFNTKVYNTFGCREVMLIASECKEQNGFHINADHLLVEIVDEQGSKIKEKNGELLITDLHNYGMPFIRYANGDMAISKESACQCGNPLPMFEKVTGRKLDILRSPNGHILPGEFFTHTLMNFTGIKKFQVIQKRLDELNINFIVDENYQKEQSEQEITEIIERFTEGSIKVKFNYKKELEITSGGKFRLTIFDVK